MPVLHNADANPASVLWSLACVCLCHTQPFNFSLIVSFFLSIPPLYPPLQTVAALTGKPTDGATLEAALADVQLDVQMAPNAPGGLQC